MALGFAQKRLFRPRQYIAGATSSIFKNNPLFFGSAYYFFFYNSEVTFQIQNLVACGTGFAYHDGTMIDDDATAYSPLECRQKCALNPACEFWDYGSSNPNWAKTCRLRSDEGSGPEASDGYSYGTWNCIFEGTIISFVSKYR